MIKLNKFNIFLPLAIVAMVAALFRVINIATFSAEDPATIGAISRAAAEEKAPAAKADPAKEGDVTKEDIEKDVHETAKAVNEPGFKEVGKKDAVPPPMTTDERMFSTSEIEVLQSLSKRRDELDKREQKITQREALLRAAEQEVDRKVTELNKLKGEMETLLGKQQTMEDDRVKSLVKIYEGMKPKDAATIFNTLDIEVLLPVVSNMKEAKTAPILAVMDTEKAKLVTVRLSEQRKLPDGKAKEGEKEGENPAAPLIE